MDKEEDDAGEEPQQRNRVLVYSETPRPIVVGAEDFQTLVQRLTGAKRKRKSVTIALVEVVHEAAGEQQEDSAQPAAAAKVREEPLLDYLDRLDKECPPPSPGAGENRGFFATAGLVKGVRREEGLQQCDTPDSPRMTSLGSSARTLELKVLAPLSYLQGYKRVCSEWLPDWTGCLSPRSGQVVEEAKRTAARWNRAGLGPWKINLEKISGSDSLGPDDESGYPVDLLYYKGEITMVEQT